MENTRLLGSLPYGKAIVIFNMTGFGLRNMDWQCVLSSSSVSTLTFQSQLRSGPSRSPESEGHPPPQPLVEIRAKALGA
ncbi:unnamed protein product [Tilletia caries]|uniref:Uncharacterized protein n=1 Tax=Tilletia caries TaxID=13290 RepID=A0ABN7IYQ1_9BASI|nr:unnamed protein product [Tilletia caries]